MPETADRDANRALRERLAGLHGRYERLRSQLDDLRQRLASVQATSVSPDGVVRATVGPRGQLIDLRLDHQAYRAIDADDLAKTIIDTVRRAANHSADDVEALLAEHFPPDTGTLRFLRDNDFASLLDRSDSAVRRDSSTPSSRSTTPTSHPAAAPGHSATPSSHPAAHPARSATPSGHSSTAPGRSATTPDRSATTPDRDGGSTVRLNVPIPPDPGGATRRLDLGSRSRDE